MGNTLKISNFCDMVQSFFDDCTDEEALNVSALYLIENIVKLKNDTRYKKRNEEENRQNKRQ